MWSVKTSWGNVSCSRLHLLDPWLGLRGRGRDQRKITSCFRETQEKVTSYDQRALSSVTKPVL